jgi:hypothetical protein
MAEGGGIVGGEGMGSGGISNVGVLDLTGMKSTEELAGIESISQVGVVLVPESLMSGLLGVPMEKVGATVAVPTGENVKLVTGQMKTTGEALAGAGREEDVLVVAGQLLVTTPVEYVGYGEIIVAGQVYAPEGSEGALTAGISRLTGQVFYYSGKPRFFVGEERFGRGFFEVLEGPMAMILVGNFAIERGVPADLLKEKVSQILLAGNLQAPQELLPLVQVLTVEKAGNISALGEGDEDEERAEP